jgi:tetratricopeptide (TPR) repeat protein
MGFRFWRRVRIAPGISLNLSKSGASLSLGGRGAHVTVGRRGTTTTVGVPGTGLYYTEHSAAAGHHAPAPPPRPAAPSPAVRPEDRLHMGFFEKLFASDEDKKLVDGLREAAAGREDEALPLLEQAHGVADAQFMMGVIRLKKNEYEAAAESLEKAVADLPHLNHYLHKYGISAIVSLPIAAGYVAHVGADECGVRLMLAEIYHQLGAHDSALACVDRLVALQPNDLVVRLARVEMLLDGPAPDPAACRAAVDAAQDVTNESTVHAALLLYKAKALRLLGLFDAAIQLLGQTLRKTKDRPPDLLQALLYERALAREAKGGAGAARADWEKLFAQNPHYADVANRLGLAPVA